MKTFKELSIEYSQLLEVQKSRANRDLRAKKMAKKVAREKKKRKCSGNMTPSVQRTGNNVKVVCTPKDRTKGVKMKKVAKRMKANVAKMRRKSAKAAATRDFRK